MNHPSYHSAFTYSRVMWVQNVPPPSGSPIPSCVTPGLGTSTVNWLEIGIMHSSAGTQPNLELVAFNTTTCVPVVQDLHGFAEGSSLKVRVVPAPVCLYTSPTAASICTFNADYYWQGTWTTVLTQKFYGTFGESEHYAESHSGGQVLHPYLGNEGHEAGLGDSGIVFAENQDRHWNGAFWVWRTPPIGDYELYADKPYAVFPKERSTTR